MTTTIIIIRSEDTGREPIELEPLAPDARDVVAIGDFVRFITDRDIGNARIAGVRFERLIREFNFNSPMVVSQVGQQFGIPYAVTRRQGVASGIWPMSMLTKVAAPVSNPAPPMVPDAI